MDDQQVETAGIVDNVLRGLALESVRALVINIDVALAVFGGQLRDLRIDDDLRMCRKVLVRVQGTVSQNAPLYTTDTSGELGSSTATASQFQIFGVVLESTASASGTSATVSTANISFPLARKPRFGT